MLSPLQSGLELMVLMFYLPLLAICCRQLLFQQSYLIFHVLGLRLQAQARSLLPLGLLHTGHIIGVFDVDLDLTSI